MAVQIKCPNCGKLHNVADELAGRAIPCAACRASGAAAGGQQPLATAPAPRLQSSGSWGKHKKKSSSPILNPFVIGGIATIVLLLVVAIVVVLIRGGDNAEDHIAATQPVQPAASVAITPAQAAPAAQQSIDIMPLKPVALKQGGTAELQLQVARNGATGPIELKVEGLPGKVTAAPLTIPADQYSAVLNLIAAADAETDSVNKVLRIRASVAGQSTEESTPITVEKVVPAKVLPIVAASIKPGAKSAINVTLERNSLEGPIQLQVEGLPEKVTAAPATIAADQSTGQIELTAAADAKEGAKDVQVAIIAGPTKMISPAKLHVESFPFRLSLLPTPAIKPMVLHIKPGEKKPIEVAVERRSYNGPIQVQLEGLPPGVTAPALTVQEGTTKATIELTADKNARELIRTVTATTTAPGTTAKEQLLVRVLTGDEINLNFLGAEQLERLFRRGSFGGRLQASSKDALIELFGGSPESEAAVMRGLKWLAVHQNPDGYWSLEKYDAAATGCTCKVDIEKEVKEEDTAGTSLALLPFLAAGVTHKSAPEYPPELKEYQTNVKRGLEFLAKYQKHSSGDDDGMLAKNMYGHAISTMALCEAYALTGDEDYKIPAQKAIKYLLKSQHGKGGWRYGPRQDGDTSVVGWVFLAIRSGQLAGLTVDFGALQRAKLFMNSVSAGPADAKQSRYSYQPGGKETVALTAAGLLTRQYLGWDKDQESLLTGANYMMQHLPPAAATSVGKVYYYYYATQVLHHLEGENWDKWNYHMREHLIRTQEKTGHQEGSWNPTGVDYGSRGGRLYSTSLSLLTLEAYYRHLPLYRKFTKPAAAKPEQAANAK